MVTDESGNILQVLDYYPYGTTRIDEHTSYDSKSKFTGQKLDSESGIYYYNSRYYNQEIGRFLSQDLAAFDTPERFLTDPQQLNMYSYARNNPILYNDPTGEFAVLPFILAVLGVILFTGAQSAYAPATAAEINHQTPDLDFLEVVWPAYEKVPDLAKISIGLGVGSIQNKFGGQVSNRVIKLFHGTTDNVANKILKEGFKDAGLDLTWFTTSSEHVKDYAKSFDIITGIQKEGSVLELNIEKNLFNSLINKGEVESRVISREAVQYGLTDKAKDIINKYIKEGNPLIKMLKK